MCESPDNLTQDNLTPSTLYTVEGKKLTEEIEDEKEVEDPDEDEAKRAIAKNMQEDIGDED